MYLPQSRKNFELPPTAGLPMNFGDIVRRPALDLLSGLRLRFGLPTLLTTCSGSAALLIALTTLRQRDPRRSNVIVPAYTCPLVVLAIKRIPGLHVLVCDTLPGGIDFDPHRLAALCDEQTLAVVPTHLGGRVADVKTARDIAIKQGAGVIEDAAQALGAMNGNVSVGLGADMAFFSLAVGKGLTTYEGGILFSRDPTLQAALTTVTARLLKPSLFWNSRRMLELLGYAFFYTPRRLWQVYGRKLQDELAKNNEMEAVGDVFTPADIPLHSLDRLRLRVAANALERLPAYLAEGRRRAASRIERLHAVKDVRVITDRPDTEGVWPFFMVLMPGQLQRDTALHTLWRSGLGVSKLFVHALPDYAYLAPSLDGPTDCPQARDLADRMLTFSNTHWLNERHFDLLVEALTQSL